MISEMHVSVYNFYIIKYDIISIYNCHDFLHSIF